MRFFENQLKLKIEPLFPEVEQNKEVNKSLIESSVIYYNIYHKIIENFNRSFDLSNADLLQLEKYFKELNKDEYYIYRDCNFYNTLSFYYYKAGKLKQSEDCFSQAFILNKRDPYLNFNYGIFCFFQQRVVEAQAYFIQAIEIDSDNIYFKLIFTNIFENSSPLIVKKLFEELLNLETSHNKYINLYIDFLLKIKNQVKVIDLNQSSCKVISKTVLPYLKNEKREEEYNLIFNLIQMEKQKQKTFTQNESLQKELEQIPNSLKLTIESYKSKARTKILNAISKQLINKDMSFRKMENIIKVSDKTIRKEISQLIELSILDQDWLVSDLVPNSGMVTIQENQSPKDKINNFYNNPLNQLLVKIGKSLTRQEIFLYMLNNCDAVGYIKVSSITLRKFLTKKDDPKTILNEIENLISIDENILSRVNDSKVGVISTYKINFKNL